MKTTRFPQKLLALLLVLMLCFGMSTAVAEEPVKLTVAGMLFANGKDWNDSIMHGYLKDNMGVDLECVTYSADDWSTQFTLMLASEEMPDLILNANMSATEVMKFGDQGYFLDFGKYLDQMPNLQATFEEYPELKSFVTQPGGEIWGFPTISGWNDATLTQFNMLNKTWLANLGLEQPNTLDELYNVLVAFRDQDANGNGIVDDETPMGYGGSAAFNPDLPILWAHGLYGVNFAYNLDVKDGTVSLMDTTEEYRDYLEYMNKLYSEKLINEDAFVVPPMEIKARILDDKIGYFGNFSSIGQLNVREDLYIINSFVLSEEQTPTGVLSHRLNPTYRILANAETEHPEVVVSLIDYFYSDEGALAAQNGWEGVTFSYKSAPGYEDYGVADHTDFYDAANYATVDTWRVQKAVMAEAFNVKNVNKGTIYDLLAHCKEEDLLSEPVWELTSLNAMREEATRMEEYKFISPPFPVVTYNEEEAAERAPLYTDISNKLTAAKADFITKGVTDEKWDQYLKELEQMGLDKLLSIEQSAYDRYIGK